ncbi:hypothetical protein [Vibrio sp. D431a]|uniref:hypothetical protein n=1 Tax=Vibrio sp. D431a TaxID=2837388 RepID=UPI002554C614|nr:hypothetical protein [Vibrio sp. D431a]MDK9790643.1 hypothetical protein [Vibrio sp. D431a]
MIDPESAKTIGNLIALSDETVGKTLTEEQLEDYKKRVREALMKSKKKYPRKPRNYSLEGMKG